MFTPEEEEGVRVILGTALTFCCLRIRFNCTLTQSQVGCDGGDLHFPASITSGTYDIRGQFFERVEGGGKGFFGHW